MIELIAYFACFILAALTLFQGALILGAPIGHLAWGGQHKVLPTKLRIASGFSILLYVLFAILIFNQAGVAAFFDSNSWSKLLFWVVTIYFCIGVPMNAVSRSKPERLVMTPVALVLAGSFLYVALNS